MQGGREKVAAKCDVTRMVVSGSRHSEGNECVYQKKESEGKFSLVDEEVSRTQESKGTEETSSFGSEHNSRMEGEFVVCEQIEEIGTAESGESKRARRRKEEQ